MARQRVDVVVVGSGAAGSLIAAKLAQAGKQVLILEAGPQRTMDSLISSQIWARRLKWSGPAVETGGASPLSVGFGSGWGTGGGALHHYACWFRLHPEDFQMRTRYGRGLDWPIAYEDLRPSYDQVQREVGLSGDAEKEVWRPPGEAYPMPPVPVWTQGQVIARGFAKLGLRTSPLPMAINTERYNGRNNCIYDGWCDAGCPIGALGNPLAVYLPQAFQAGAEILHDRQVTRVLTNPEGTHATGVECYNAQGQRETIEARVVVLAAYVFETPRILLNSRPGGLANSSGTLGRYMMAHSTSNVFGFFDEDTDNHMGVTGGQLLSQDNYLKDPARGYLSGYQWLIGNALKPNDLLGIANSRADLFGQPLHDFMQRAAKHLATMTFVGEGLPERDNRVELGTQRDRFGLPLAKATHQFAADSIQCWEDGLRQGKAIFEAAGAKEVWTSGRNQMHTLGGAIMGTSPRESVTNGYGQTHDVDNLFVAGSSLFPTSGAVNPTFTLTALALRTSQHLLATWNRFR
jgi:choline dehydrogenase-like flavoprotein